MPRLTTDCHRRPAADTSGRTICTLISCQSPRLLEPQSSFVGGLAMLACCVAVGFAVGAEAPAGSRWAVLVGVDDYAKLRRLEHAVSDMRALAEELVAGGFARDHVYVLADRAEKAVFLPTKRNIEERLDLVLSLVKPNDVVVVGFAGHGVEVRGKSYWCPTEALVDGDDADISQTLVPLDAVYSKLTSCQAALKLIVADACRDDPRRTRSGTPMRIDVVAKALANPPEGILVLNSCGPGEQSQEDSKLGHGVFTHFLLSGLRGDADADADGSVTLAELFEHAGTRTKKHVADQFASFQTPRLSGEVSPGVLRFPIAAPQAGEVVNSLGMKLVRIKAGEFSMGSAESKERLKAAGFGFFDYGDYDCSNESPVHRVRITKPFFMGKTEVTLGQFLHFYHDGYRGRLDCEQANKADGFNATSGSFEHEKNNYRPWSWGHRSQTNDHPVLNVSWNDSVAFCKWLSRKEGKTYRLPTEAEWEYACRGGTTTRFWFGNEAESLTTVDNVADGSAKSHFSAWNHTLRSQDGYAWTSPVGALDRPNPFGLHDMHGNVAEWCNDYYDRSYYKASPEADPQGPPAGSKRVIRGGGWMFDAAHCRSANRFGQWATECDYRTGFRVVCALE